MRTQTSAPPATFADTIQQPPAQGGWQQQYGNGTLAPEQFNSGVDAATAQAICGEVAAVAFARAYGRNPTVAEALDIARRNGRWDANVGMHGPPSEKALLDDMGIPNRLEPNPSQDAVLRDLDNGNPVILSSPGHDHYFVVTGYQRQPDGSVLFDTGNTGQVFRNNPHRYWSWDEIGPQAALFMQEPTAQGPSTATDMSPQQGTPAAPATPDGRIASEDRYGDTTTRKQAYAAALWPVAKRYEAQTGIPAELFLGIGGSESNFGNAPGYSLFGIMAGAGEQRAGVGTADGNLKGYNSLEESVADFAALMQSPRYAAGLEAYKAGKLDLRGLISSVRDAGYDAPSDPNYQAWPDMVMGALGQARPFIPTGRSADVTPGGTPTGTYSPTSAGYQPQFDTTRSTGGNQPPPPESDPWAPVNATLDRVRTGIADLNRGAQDTLNAASDTGAGLLNTVGDRLIDPNTYAQSAGGAGDVAARGGTQAAQAVGEAYRTRPADTLAAATRFVLTGDTSGFDNPVQRAIALGLAGVDALYGAPPVLTGQGLGPQGAISTAFNVAAQATDPIARTVVGGVQNTLEGRAAGGAPAAMQRADQLGWVGQLAIMALNPTNFIPLGGAGHAAEGAATRAVEGAAQEAGRLGEGLVAPTAGPVGRVVGRGLEVIGQGGVAGGAIDDARPSKAVLQQLAEKAQAGGLTVDELAQWSMGARTAIGKLEHIGESTHVNVKVTLPGSAPDTVAVTIGRDYARPKTFDTEAVREEAIHQAVLNRLLDVATPELQRQGVGTTKLQLAAARQRLRAAAPPAPIPEPMPPPEPAPTGNGAAPPPEPLPVAEGAPPSATSDGVHQGALQRLRDGGNRAAVQREFGLSNAQMDATVEAHLLERGGTTEQVLTRRGLLMMGRAPDSGATDADIAAGLGILPENVGGNVFVRDLWNVAVQRAREGNPLTDAERTALVHGANGNATIVDMTLDAGTRWAQDHPPVGGAPPITGAPAPRGALPGADVVRPVTPPISDVVAAIKRVDPAISDEQALAEAQFYDRFGGPRKTAQGIRSNPKFGTGQQTMGEDLLPRTEQVADALEHPATAAPTAVPAAPARPGFAGRWNISKFPPEMQDAMRAAYEADPAGFEAASRGTISDPQLEQMAREVDIGPILDRWAPGTILNGEETRAAQYAVARAFNDAKVAAAGGDSTEATNAFALAVRRAMASVGVGSEQGRALRARRGTIEADAFLNWREVARSGVEDAFARVNGVHDEIAAVIRDLPGAARARATAALDEARAAADEGYRAARNGVADHPTEAPATNGTIAPETRVEGQQGAVPPEAAPEVLGPGKGPGEGPGAGGPDPEMRPASDLPATDANGRPLTRAQRMALERDRIRREFALARYGKRLEETTARERATIEALAKKQEALLSHRASVLAEQERIRQEFSLARYGKRMEELTARDQARVEAVARERLAKVEARARADEQALNLKHERDLAAQEQRIAAQESRKGYSERIKLEQQREAAKDSTRAAAERQAIRDQQAHELRLRVAEQNHQQAMVKLFDAISDPARKNLVRQLAGTLGGRNKNLTPWQQAARAIKVAQRGRTIKPDQQQQLYKNLIRAVTGVDDPAEQARRMQALRVIVQRGNTEEMGRLLQKANAPDFWGHVQAYYVANILSGSATHVRNVVGNTGAMALSPVEHALTVPIEAGLAKLQGRPRERFMGEIPHEIGGWLFAIPEAAQRFKAIMRHGFDPANMERLAGVRGEVKGGGKNPINWVFRGLGGMDAFFGHMVYMGELNRLAYRQARMERLTGQAFVDRFADLVSVPTAEMVEGAQKAARYRTYKQEMDGFGQWLRKSHDAGWASPLMRTVMPFISTPYNIVRFDLERSPLAAAKIAWDLAPESKMLRKGPSAYEPQLALGPGGVQTAQPPVKSYADISDRLGRLVLGTAAFVAVTQGYQNDLITGNGPPDPGERDLWLGTHQPNSFKVGDHWVSWLSIPALGTVMGLTTGALDAQRYGKGDAAQIAASAGTGMMQSIVRRSFFQGLANLFDAIAPGGGGPAMASRFMTNTASGLIPAGAALRGVARGLDREVKQPMSTVEGFTQNLPGLSRQVQPRLDRRGEPITRPDYGPVGNMADALLSPFQTDVPSDDPTLLTAQAAGQAFPGVGGTIAGQGLDNQQKYDYQKLTGQLVAARRAALYATDAYKQADKLTQDDMAAKSDVLAQSRARALFAGQAGIDLSPDKPDKYDPRLYDLLARSLPPDQVAAYRQNPVLLELDVADAVRAMTDYRQSRGTTPRPTRAQMQLASLSSSKYWSREYALWSRDPARRSAAAQQDATVRGLATATP